MNPEIYSEEEIDLIFSLFAKFRAVIEEDDPLYGFSLAEFDEVVDQFPNVDLHDEAAGECDHSGHVLNNMFAFLCSNKPTKILSTDEMNLVQAMWQKLQNA